MKKFINKIMIKIDKEKVKHWVKSKRKFREKNEYYICRICRHVFSEDYMNANDNSICNDCSKH